MTTTVKHAGISSLAEIIGLGLGYLFTLLLTRTLSTHDYGLFALVMTITSFGALLARFGLENTSVRYVALYRSQAAFDALRGLLRFATTLGGWGGAVLVLALFLLSAPIEAILSKPGLALLLRWGALVVWPLTVTPIWLGTLQGFHQISQRAWLEQILYPTLKLALVSIALLMGWGLPGTVVSITTASILYAATAGNVLRTTVRQNVAAGPQRLETAEWLAFALPMLLESLFFVPLVGSLDILILGYFRPAEEVGIYNAVLRLAPLTAVPMFAFNRAFSPTIAQLYSNGDSKQLARSFKMVTRWTFTFSLPILITFALGGRAILAWFGSEFTAGALVLTTLSLGRLIDAATGPVNYMLVMTGHPRLNLLNSGLLLLFDIGLSLWLVPSYGLLGMAVAQTVSVATVNLLRLLEVGVILKMVPYDRRFLRPLLAGLLSIGLFAAITRLWTFASSAGGLLLTVLLVDVVYLGLVGSVVLDAEDRGIIGQLLKGKLKQSE